MIKLKRENYKINIHLKFNLFHKKIDRKVILGKKFYIRLILIFILLWGFYFRFSGLRWDQGFLLHPDEGSIVYAAKYIEIPNKLDPGYYVYNGFMIYITRIICEILARVMHDPNWILQIESFVIVNRFVSATVSVFAMIVFHDLTKYITKKINYRLLGTFIFASTVGLIQYAHFGVTESMLVFLSLLCSWGAARVLEFPKGTKYYVVMGISLGLAIGTKTSAIIFTIIPVSTIIILFIQKKLKVPQLLDTFSAIVLSLIAFMFSSPYNIIKFQSILARQNYERLIIEGSLTVPWNLQFFGTPPYLYHLQNLVWHLGPVVLIFSLVGLAMFIYFIIKKRNKVSISILPLIIFSIVYFAYMGPQHTKFIRYMVPIIPFFIIMFIFFVRYAREFKFLQLTQKIVIVLAVMIAVMYPIAFNSVYATEHTRITATKWIYTHIKPGSIIINEHWDVGLPLNMEGYNVGQYNFIEMKVFNGETEDKMKKMSENLAKGDIIVLSSRRGYGSIPNARSVMPLTTKYYELLFEEKLGFKKLIEFTSYPRIGSLELNTRSAEETFEVADHPKIIIFAKTEKKTSEEIYQLVTGNQ